MTTTAIVIVIILAFLLIFAVASLVLVWKQLATARIDVARAQSELEAGNAALARTEESARTLESQLETLRTEATEYQKQVAALNARQEEAVKARDEARAKLEETFKALSADVLKSSTEQFLQLAKQKLEGQQKESQAELDKRKQAFETLVKPINETLKNYQTAITDIEKARKESYGSLRQQLIDFAKDQKQLRDETQKLVSALRRPEVRGRWGEIQLRRVVELAGMIEHCDFDEQQHLTTQQGRALRPDMVVMLPNHRTIVIDAKTPLDAYLNAIEAPDESQRKQFLNNHTRQIEEQVANLAGKNYIAQFDHSPDFVILFIPGEPFLQAAVQLKPDMIESALEKGVVIATPSTLISLLKVVALGWREEQMTENAEQIAQAGRELHKRLAVAFDHLDRLRKAINNTVEHFNKTVGSFNSQVLPQARRFEELGSASPGKTLPFDTPTIDMIPRAVPQLPHHGQANESADESIVAEWSGLEND